MKIIFLGTPQFAVPTLEALISSHHEVVAVVSQPGKAAGRGKKIMPSAVEVVAQNHGIAVYQFEKISLNGVRPLSEIEADAIVTCAYGQILSKEILTMKRYGVINVHGSLLPKYRGASPIQWTIINGEKLAGISILQSDVGLDDGPVIARKETAVLSGETAEELFDRLSHFAPPVLLGALDALEEGTAVFTPQNHAQATVCKKLTKQMSNVSFNNSAQQIVNLINGLNVWPVAKISLENNEIKVYRAETVSAQQLLNSHPNANAQNAKVGEVVVSGKGGLIVKATDIFVSLLVLQLPNSKKLHVKDFLNGKKINVGSVINE